MFLRCFSACGCINRASLVAAVRVCLWPCLWVGAHVSLGIFSTTSHCIAMTLIHTPSDSSPPPPPSPILLPPTQSSTPVLRAVQSAGTLTVAGRSQQQSIWKVPKTDSGVGGWMGGGGGLISKSGDERQIRQIGPLISYQYTAVAAPLSLNLKNQLEQSKDGFNDLFSHTGGYRAKLRCLIRAAQACEGWTCRR